MPVPAQKLEADLREHVRHLYWVAGDDPFLIGECADRIRNRLRNCGCTDRTILHADNPKQFDWSSLMDAVSARSLFDPDALVELHLPGGKPDKGADTLCRIADSVERGNRLLVIGPRMDRRTLSSKWAKAIDRAGLIVQVYNLNRNDLGGWVRSQLRHYDLDAEPEALQVIADCAEGNLVAAHQEIAKLALQYQGQSISAEVARESIADGSRFRSFDLVDAALAGEVSRVVHTLHRLREEGEAVPPLLGTLTNDIRKLLRIRISLDHGQRRERAFAENQIWKQRERMIIAALQRHDERACQTMLRMAAVVDRSVKGLDNRDPWVALEQLALKLCGQPVLEDC